MTFATRTTALTLTLLLAVAAGTAAQDTTKASPAPAETATAAPAVAGTVAADSGATAEPRTSRHVRHEFSQILRQSPPELGTILTLDPTLLSNEAFLSGYPSLARFVAENSEVRRNPRFYLAEFDDREENRGSGRGIFNEMVEGITIFSTILVIAFALGWFIRTIIEQKRWNRLTRTQSEVHNKILDRFSTSEEVLSYVKTAAGTKFLESAPIPLHAEQAAQNAPLSRVLWSVQLGVVVAISALGLLLVSLRFDAETGQALFAMGMIAFSIGAGFIASAMISMALSRRLGLWQEPGASPPDVLSDSGPVR